MVMIRTLAVTVAFLVAVGVASPLVASAQTSGQGQAVGILFLLGASKSGTQGNAKAPGQKPKPAVSREAQARIADAKPTPLTAKVAPTDSSTGKHN